MHRVEPHHIRAVASLGRRTALIATPAGPRLVSAATNGTLLTRTQLAEAARQEGTTLALYVNANAERIADRLNADLEAKEP
ncbi:hypothetical protein [Micromonospora carbonacea]|uniref:hypothetical protein n=1 Tax=Micromonospora carbonacea TaxID=47853 RepID=UPI0037109630